MDHLTKGSPHMSLLLSFNVLPSRRLLPFLHSAPPTYSCPYYSGSNFAVQGAGFRVDSPFSPSARAGRCHVDDDRGGKQETSGIGQFVPPNSWLTLSLSSPGRRPLLACSVSSLRQGHTARKSQGSMGFAFSPMPCPRRCYRFGSVRGERSVWNGMKCAYACR